MQSTDIIKPLAITQPVATDGTKFNIPESATGSERASISTGFPDITMKSLADGGKPPRGEDFNGLFYLSTDQRVYVQNGGVITFDQNVSDTIGGYPKGAILDYVVDNNFYKVQSVIENNTYNFVTNPEYIDNQKWSYMTLSTSSALETKVSNALLGATNGNITVTDYTNTSYINQGCSVSDSNVVSGFSESDYILLSKTMTDAVNFTLEIPFNLTSTAGTQYIAQINNEANAIGVENGFLILTYDGSKETGTIALQPNIDYTLQLARNAANKTYTLSLKTTGDYTTHITLNSPSGFFADKSIYLGGGSANFLQGTINLGNVAITADSASYWTISTTSDFQAVTVSGQFETLMPDGLNIDNTFKNENSTLNINKTLIYTPNGAGKTVILKNDGEVMLRDYVVSPTEPETLGLSGVWYDNVKNVMSEQSILYANLQMINPTGDAPVITNGILNITADGQYADLAGTFDLGNEWNISLNLTAQPTANNSYILGDVTVSEDGTVTPSGIALQYDNGNITAYFRRNDVLQVSKTVVVSTAYIVSKDSGSTVGYVATEGDTGAYVAADTPVYSNQEMTTLLENAAADTWTYSGESANNTETTTGYVKEGSESPNFVPPSTQVYSDANCTTPQAVTTGTDYVYDNVSAVSMIGTLTTTYSDTVTMGFNGTQYTLGTQTLTSSDNIKGGCNITLGGAPNVSSAITGINLNTSVFSFWQWNGSSLETPSYLPFVGAKIGEIKDSNGLITSTKIDTPLALANSSLSNLTEEGEKHFLNKSQITNCLLEVPQRVKVELNDGSLTLKAGSVVIVPYGTSAPTMEIGDTLNGGEIVDISWDGSKLFYYVRYEQDKTSTYTPTSSYNDNVFTPPNGAVIFRNVKASYSGDSAPTISSNYALWYDTANNIVKHTENQGQTWENYLSLPFCIAGVTQSVGITSLENIFNGFGFIGSTVWIDKGVKALIPNGRNADGSLKNIEYTTSKIIPTQTNIGTRLYLYRILDGWETLVRSEYIYIQDEQPDAADFDYTGTNAWFSPGENYWRIYENGGWQIVPVLSYAYIDCGNTTAEFYRPVSFKTKQAFRAVDYNDTEFIAHQAMPSETIVTLSVGASGATYTAPADGYVIAYGKANSSNDAYLDLMSSNSRYITHAYTQDIGLAVTLPVTKSKTFMLNYTRINIIALQFVYANGAI